MQLFGYKIFNLKNVLLLWATIFLIYRILICLSFRPELSNGEINNVWKAINVAQGNSIYEDPEKMPLEIFQYTPISQIPINFIAKSLNENSIYYVYWITALGRCYELICNLFAFYLLYRLLVRYLSVDRTYAFLITLINLTLLTTPSFTIRPDATLLLGLVSIIYLFFRYENKGLNINCLLLSLSIIICFYIKQDGILISIPLGIRLILLKKWNHFLRLVLFTVTFFIISLVLMSFICGPYFFKSTLLGLNNTASLTQVISVFDRAYSFYSIHFILGISLSIYLLIKYKNHSLNVFSILLLFYLLVALFTSSKTGSWVNYYTPFVIFSSIVILCFVKIIVKTNHTKLIGVIVLIFSFLFTTKQIYAYTSPFLRNSESKQNYLNKFQLSRNLATYLHINKNDNVLILDHLPRTFLAQNSIMVNIEYFSYSKFSYSNIKKATNKGIDYIIYTDNDIPAIGYLLKYFEVETNDFDLETKFGYNIYRHNKRK